MGILTCQFMNIKGYLILHTFKTCLKTSYREVHFDWKKYKEGDNIEKRQNRVSFLNSTYISVFHVPEVINKIKNCFLKR